MIHLVFFLISGLGYFTFFTDTQSTTEKVEQNNKRTNEDLGLLQAEEERNLKHFCASCELTWVCTQENTLTGPLAMLTNLSALFISVDCLLSSPFCWLCPSLDFYPLPTVLFCSFLLTILLLTALSCLLSQGSSFPRPLPVSREISHAGPLCGFCARTDKEILWHAPTHKPTQQMPNIVSQE